MNALHKIVFFILIGHSLLAQVKDIDGNKYDFTNIGGVLWSTTNLNVSRYNDGTEIKQAKNLTDWKNAAYKGEAAWCYLDFNENNKSKYGKLYNAYVDLDKIAPLGTEVLDTRDAEFLEKVYSDFEKFKELKSINGWGFENKKVECRNCIDWSYSYRQKVPCNVCKDKREIQERGMNLDGNNKSKLNFLPSKFINTREFDDEFLKDFSFMCWLKSKNKRLSTLAFRTIPIEDKSSLTHFFYKNNSIQILESKESVSSISLISAGSSIRIKLISEINSKIFSSLNSGDYKQTDSLLKSNTWCINPALASKFSTSEQSISKSDLAAVKYCLKSSVIPIFKEVYSQVIKNYNNKDYDKLDVLIRLFFENYNLMIQNNQIQNTVSDELNKARPFDALNYLLAQLIKSNADNLKEREILYNLISRFYTQFLKVSPLVDQRLISIMEPSISLLNNQIEFLRNVEKIKNTEIGAEELQIVGEWKFVNECDAKGGCGHWFHSRSGLYDAYRGHLMNEVWTFKSDRSFTLDFSTKTYNNFNSTVDIRNKKMNGVYDVSYVNNIPYISIFWLTGMNKPMKHQISFEANKKKTIFSRNVNVEDFKLFFDNDSIEFNTPFQIKGGKIY
jgi:hypothetical protein